MMRIPHAAERVAEWRGAWQRSGRLVVLLDFDGTLAPIVDRPEQAAMPERTRAAIEALRRRAGVDLAIVSGRGLEDARQRAGLTGIAYAGNHGMEIDGPGVRRVHAEAARARPLLEAVARRLREELHDVRGALVEDKHLTLSIHYRLVAPPSAAAVEDAVRRAAAEVPELRVTAGKMVWEVRPRVDWHKGRAVEFLLAAFAPPAGAPVLYFGDDTTDEDAFRALAALPAGEGVFVGERPPPATAARSWLRSPLQVGELLVELGE